MNRFLLLCLGLLFVSCHKKPIAPVNDVDIIAAETLLNTPQQPIAISGDAYFFGDSITQGFIAGVVITNNWVALTTLFTGLTGHNLGIGGSTLERTIGGEVRATSMYSRAIAEIPQKKATDRYLFFAYGINDAGFVYADVNTDQFKADYQYILNIAYNYGWKPQDIVILGVYYCKPQSADQASRILPFNAAIQSIILSNGTRYIDIYSYMQNHGGDYLVSEDGIHPTDIGYAVIARGVEEALRTFNH